MADKGRGLTYAQTGVDIDAGNRMVELIKPLVRATARRGADGEIVPASCDQRVSYDGRLDLLPS